MLTIDRVGRRDLGVFGAPIERSRGLLNPGQGWGAAAGLLLEAGVEGEGALRDSVGLSFAGGKDHRRHWEGLACLWAEARARSMQAG